MQWLAASLALAGLWGIRQKATWGPLVAAGGSIAWIAYGAATEQWGLAMTECVYLVSYLGIAAAWAKESPPG